MIWWAAVRTATEPEAEAARCGNADEGGVDVGEEGAEVKLACEEPGGEITAHTRLNIPLVQAGSLDRRATG